MKITLFFIKSETTNQNAVNLLRQKIVSIKKSFKKNSTFKTVKKKKSRQTSRSDNKNEKTPILKEFTF